MVTGKAPAFQFYAAEYLADENVQLLTLEEEGIYIRLLAYCWREGSIPADPAKLSRLCKSAPAAALAGVMQLFEAGAEGRLVHRRLEDERRKHEEYKAGCAARGAEGARKRWQVNSHPIADPLCSDSPPMNQPMANDGFASAFASSFATESEVPKTLALTALAVPAAVPVITLALNDRTEFAVTQPMVTEWGELYPAVDIMQQLRNMKGWCHDNPQNRKTRTGIRKFMGSWLSKEQNKALPVRGDKSNAGSERTVGPAIARQRGNCNAIDEAARLLRDGGSAASDAPNGRPVLAVGIGPRRPSSHGALERVV